MTRLTFHQAAEEHERYDPHAFDRIIGQTAPFKFSGVEIARATVVAVEVDEDQRGATWTVDVPDDSSLPDSIRGEAGQYMSFAVPEVPERWWE